MRDGTNIPIKADADLLHQIVLCGLSLLHQLVAGEKYKHTLFNTDHDCNEQISFGDLQRQIIREIATADNAFDAIEKELCRQTGPRVEQLLKKVFFGLLAKAAEVANNPNQQDEM